MKAELDSEIKRVSLLYPFLSRDQIRNRARDALKMKNTLPGKRQNKLVTHVKCRLQFEGENDAYKLSSPSPPKRQLVKDNSHSTTQATIANKRASRSLQSHFMDLNDTTYDADEDSGNDINLNACDSNGPRFYGKQEPSRDRLSSNYGKRRKLARKSGLVMNELPGSDLDSGRITTAEQKSRSYDARGMLPQAPVPQQVPPRQKTASVLFDEMVTAVKPPASTGQQVVRRKVSVSNPIRSNSSFGGVKSVIYDEFEDGHRKEQSTMASQRRPTTNIVIKPNSDQNFHERQKKSSKVQKTIKIYGTPVGEATVFRQTGQPDMELEYAESDFLDVVPETQEYDQTDGGSRKEESPDAEMNAERIQCLQKSFENIQQPLMKPMEKLPERQGSGQETGRQPITTTVRGLAKTRNVTETLGSKVVQDVCRSKRAESQEISKTVAKLKTPSARNYTTSNNGSWTEEPKTTANDAEKAGPAKLKDNTIRGNKANEIAAKNLVTKLSNRYSKPNDVTAKGETTKSRHRRSLVIDNSSDHFEEDDEVLVEDTQITKIPDVAGKMGPTGGASRPPKCCPFDAMDIVDSESEITALGKRTATLLRYNKDESDDFKKTRPSEPKRRSKKTDKAKAAKVRGTGKGRKVSARKPKPAVPKMPSSKSAPKRSSKDAAPLTSSKRTSAEQNAETRTKPTQSAAEASEDNLATKDESFLPESISKFKEQERPKPVTISREVQTDAKDAESRGRADSTSAGVQTDTVGDVVAQAEKRSVQQQTVGPPETRSTAMQTDVQGQDRMDEKQWKILRMLHVRPRNVMTQTHDTGPTETSPEMRINVATQTLFRIKDTDAGRPDPEQSVEERRVPFGTGTSWRYVGQRDVDFWNDTFEGETECNWFDVHGEQDVRRGQRFREREADNAIRPKPGTPEKATTDLRTALSGSTKTIGHTTTEPTVTTQDARLRGILEGMESWKRKFEFHDSETVGQRSVSSEDEPLLDGSCNDTVDEELDSDREEEDDIESHVTDDTFLQTGGSCTDFGTPQNGPWESAYMGDDIRDHASDIEDDKAVPMPFTDGVSNTSLAAVLFDLEEALDSTWSSFRQELSHLMLNKTNFHSTLLTLEPSATKRSEMLFQQPHENKMTKSIAWI